MAATEGWPWSFMIWWSWPLLSFLTCVSGRTGGGRGKAGGGRVSWGCHYCPGWPRGTSVRASGRAGGRASKRASTRRRRRPRSLAAWQGGKLLLAACMPGATRQRRPAPKPAKRQAGGQARPRAELGAPNGSQGHICCRCCRRCCCGGGGAGGGGRRRTMASGRATSKRPASQHRRKFVMSLMR